MDTNFTIGDVVVLKSGSPRMTIQKIQNGIAECVWYSEGQGKYLTEHFYDFCLGKVS